MSVMHEIPNRQLLGGYTREQWQFFRNIVDLVPSNYEQILAQSPQTVREKANKVLMAIQRQTKEFGARVPLGGQDYPLGYARSCEEFRAFLQFLFILGS